MAIRNTASKDVIRDKHGAIVKVAHDGNRDKRFAIIAKCGHVGTGYFKPVCFSIMAKDIESAIDIVKAFPRVKRDAKNVILGASEVSLDEALLLLYNNDHDWYLKGNFADENWSMIQKTRIVEDYMIYNMLEQLQTGAKDKDGPALVSSDYDIPFQTADQYAKHYTLQKAYAPYRVGDKYYYPKNVNVKDVLAEYYTDIAVHLGLIKNSVFVIGKYYQIFGPNNELGFNYENGQIVFTQKNGLVRKFTIPAEQRKYIEKTIADDSFVLKNYKKKSGGVALDFEEVIKQTESSSVARKSQTDKFRSRLAKTEKLHTQKQPGEE